MALAISLPRVVEPLFPLPPPRSVGTRGGMCVAFTLADAFRILARDATEISAQFIYWACKERDGVPGDVGTKPIVAAKVLQELGVCTEATWPYQPEHVDHNNPGQGPPPPGAIEEAGLRRLNSWRLLPGKHVHGMRIALACGSPLLLGLYVTEHWNNSWPGNTLGRLRTPLPGEDRAQGTTLCVIGYRDDLTAPGGGYFIARNYENPTLGRANPDGPGHCHVAYSLVAEDGLVAIAFESVIIEQPEQPEVSTKGEEAFSTVGRGSLILLEGEAGREAEQLYPNGVSPEGEPLLQIDAAAAARLAQARADPKELQNLYRAKVRSSTESTL